MSVTAAAQPESIDLHGCYDGSWKGLIVDDAFAHPAKFAPGLVRRIYTLMLDRGWLAPGDLVGDPFGGIAGGGIIAAYAGLRWVGVELEPRFVALAERNIALHRAKLAAVGLPVPEIVQGDSRWFAGLVGRCGAVVGSPPFLDARSDTTPSRKGASAPTAHDPEDWSGRAGGIVTSPPYADSVKAEGDRIDWEKVKDGGKGRTLGRSAVGGGYSGIVTSPPWGDQEPSHGQQGGFAPPNDSTRRLIDSEYGATPGQIGELPAGDLGAVVKGDSHADDLDLDRRLLRGRGLRDLVRGNAGTRGTGCGGDDRPEGEGTARRDPSLSVGPGSPEPTALLSQAVPEQVARADQRLLGAPDSPAARYRPVLDEGAPAPHSEAGEESDGPRSPETYWEAVAQVYRECLRALRPGGVMAVVVKDYCKAGKVVPLCDGTLALLESLGFEPLARARAHLVKETTHAGIFADVTQKTERKSFFRRLAEKKGSPRIDWETVLFVRASGATP